MGRAILGLRLRWKEELLYSHSVPSASRYVMPIVSYSCNTRFVADR